MVFLLRALCVPVVIFRFKNRQKGWRVLGKSRFKPICAITLPTRPRFGAVLVTAIRACMGILNLH